MILDGQEELGAAVAATSAGQYTVSSKDLGNITPKRDVAEGEPMCLLFALTVAAAGATDTTDFMAVQSVNADLSSHDVLSTVRVPNAQLVLGRIVVVPLPPGRITKRYIGGRYGLGAGDTLTARCFGPLPQSFADRAPKNIYNASGIVV